MIPWIKKNLFSSPINALLTLGSLWLSYLMFVPAFTFVFHNANWKVIVDNIHLFAVGSYPVEQLWRILLNLVLLMGLFGASIATRTTMGIKSWSLFFLFSGTAVWNAVAGYGSSQGGFNDANHYFLVAGAIFYLLGYTLFKFGQKFKKARAYQIVLGWFFYIFISLILLSGFTDSTVLPRVENHLWGGLLLTSLVTIVGIVASFPLGVALALGRRSHLPGIRWLCIGFIETIRGVPLITLLFMGQILIPLFLPPALVVSNLVRVMIAVTLFAAAYMAEYVRGGLQALPVGQIEASQALGLNRIQTNLFIVLPQAIRAVIPALVGECIALFKDTSLVAIVGLLDLTGAAKAAIGQPAFIGLEAEVFMTIALIYWIFSFIMSRYSRNLEKQLGVGVR
ncbi:MAG: amino acid ABC transporter permease [Nitrospiria bacterium]